MADLTARELGRRLRGTRLEARLPKDRWSRQMLLDWLNEWRAREQCDLCRLRDLVRQPLDAVDVLVGHKHRTRTRSKRRG